jgi:hypothetical protein
MSNQRATGSPAVWERESMAAYIQTGRGSGNIQDMGLILPHEHLFTDLRGPLVPDYAQAEPEVVAQAMAPDLEAAHEAGVTALVECSTVGVGRNVAVLQRLAEVTPIHIVAPTGLYREQFVPPRLRSMSVEELAEEWIRELKEGIKISVSDDGPTPLEVRNLQAAGGRCRRQPHRQRRPGLARDGDPRNGGPRPGPLHMGPRQLGARPGDPPGGRPARSFR